MASIVTYTHRRTFAPGNAYIYSVYNIYIIIIYIYIYICPGNAYIYYLYIYIYLSWKCYISVLEMHTYIYIYIHVCPGNVYVYIQCRSWKYVRTGIEMRTYMYNINTETTYSCTHGTQPE